MKRLLLLTLAACSAHAVEPAARSIATAPPADRPAPIATATIAEPAPPPPVADPPGAWLTRPPAKADFYVALDGLCRYLRVEQVSGEAFAVTTTPPYIGAPDIAIFARLTPAGLEDMSKGVGDLEGLTGTYPDAMFGSQWSHERIYIGSEIVQWKKDRWVVVLENPRTKDDNAMRREYEMPIPWKHGYVAIYKWAKRKAGQTYDDPNQMDEGKDIAVLDLPPTSVAPLAKAGFTPETLTPLKTGELFVAGHMGASPNDTPLIRWLDAGGAVHEYATKGVVATDGRIVVGQKTIARYDGTAFVTTDLPPEPPTPAAPVKVEPPEKGASVIGNTWAYSKTDVWKREGDTWTKKTLPPPAFGTSKDRTITSLQTRSSGEVVIVVGYYEKGRGWRDPVLYHEILRSERPAETLRCNEPDPENIVLYSGTGYTSWPPLADEACTTPFVVLARKSNANPPMVKDWPAIRAAVKGKKNLGESIDLVEVRAGDRTIVGASTKTFGEARTLLDTVSKAIATRAEIVCAVPTASKTFHVDVATGNVTK